MDRRDFIKTTGLGAVAGWTLAPWPSFGFAEDATPEERVKRLAGLMDEHRLFDRGTRRVYRDTTRNWGTDSIPGPGRTRVLSR